MHSPGHSLAAPITSNLYGAIMGNIGARAGSHQQVFVLPVLYVGKSVDVELEDLRGVLNAKPIASAEVLINPDLQRFGVAHVS